MIARQRDGLAGVPRGERDLGRCRGAAILARGRVGRGSRRGICIVCGEETPRLRALCATTDGFVLAEEDLRIRGAGELMGTAQSGFGDLRALDPIEDIELLSRARKAVKEEP